VPETFRALASRAWNGFLAYVVKFGVVGLIGLVIDVALFNALRLGVVGEGTWAQSAIGAKTISTTVAIVFNWLGNRYWTFRRHRRRHALREFAEYAVVSVGGMAIALLCLWVSHYMLGFTSLLADNIATNVIGLALGTAFRFLLYRYWVFGHHRVDGLSNLARVEEAQRALFEEPPLEPAPEVVGVGREPEPAPEPLRAPEPAEADAATRRPPGTTADTPRPGSSSPPPAVRP
jgi:putative flippase GtrA